MIITCPNNVKLTKNTTKGGVDQFGISEVRITRNNNTFANGVHQPFFMQQRPRSTDIAIVVSQSSSELISPSRVATLFSGRLTMAATILIVR